MMMSAFAATEEITDFITITVTDEDGNALENATVNFVINSIVNGDSYIQKEEKTDKNGCVKILSSEEYVKDDMTLTATISKDKYQTDTSINELKITGLNQNIDIVLKSTVIKDVEVTGQTLTYNGKPQKAVIVSKKDTDTVDYDFVSESVTLKDGEPYVTDAGTYEFNVTVSREGFEPYKKTITTTVNKADIDGITFEAIEGLKYNEKEQDLVKVSGINYDTDTVKYEVNGKEVEVEAGKVPQELAVAKYKVKLTVDRGSNYNQFEKTVEAEIGLGEIELGGLKVTGLNSVYTGKTQQAISVTGQDENYSLKYKLNDGEYVDDYKELTVTNAGSYIAYVLATKENYKDKNVTVENDPKLLPFNVYIAKANQKDLYFNNSELPESVILDEDNKENNKYDFSVSGGSTGEPVCYSVDDDRIASIDNKGLLTAKTSGFVKVTATLNETENFNKKSISAYVSITVPDNNLIFFKDNEEIVEEVDYTFGSNKGVLSTYSADKKYKDEDRGNITYSISDSYLDINDDGKVVINDYSALAKELQENGGKIRVEVTAEKSKDIRTEKKEKPSTGTTVYFTDSQNWGQAYAYCWNENSENAKWHGAEMTHVGINGYGQNVYKYKVSSEYNNIIFNGNNGEQTVDIPFDGTTTGFYADEKRDGKWTVGFWAPDYEEDIEYDEYTYTAYDESHASYIINITFASTPDVPYALDGTIGENDWYTSDVKVIPAEGYSVAKTELTQKADNFEETITFNNQGIDPRYIYLRDSETGGITDKTQILDSNNNKIKIDTQKPDANNFSIEFSEPNTDKDNTKYYKEGVTVTFTVEDELDNNESGVHYIDWKYTKAENATSSILTEKSDRLFVTKKDGKYTASITLESDKQYRGNISFTATDNAGNESEVKFNDTVIVVDDINPKMQAAHQLVKSDETYNPVGNIHYYSDDVRFTFTINEANFYESDFKVQLSKDGLDKQDVNVTWKHDNEVHTGSFIISGDGDYIVYVNPDYSDRSGNMVKDENDNDIINYESELITIDTTTPVINCDFDETEQSVKFTVEEHNFRPTDVSVEYSVVDINGNIVPVSDINEALHKAEWKKEGADVYTYETKALADGLYSYKVSYTDISNNKAEDKSKIFTIDHSSPSDPEITYSNPITESIISSLTFGFYNPTVDVTFTSYDNFSGVASFKWSYIKQIGESNINVDSSAEKYTDKDIPAVQDSKDKSKFTATVTLPRAVADQLRGDIAASATDNYKNTSQKVTDSNHVIVVDTITPEMTVEYSEASRTVGKVSYYGNDKKGEAVATFKIKEANFFAEDVKVSISKNGGEKTKVKPTWTDVSVDDHIGTYTISGDGHYIVYVEYTDRSNNKMTSYTSDMITVDTIKPVIKVDYDNKDVIEKLTDKENHKRSYFDAKQKATITITEHNFDSKEVELSKIVAKDVTGKTLDLSKLISYSSWSDKGDVHTLNITYSGDANYTFDIDYTDLANNNADDYKPDYFTVDTKAPVVTGVSYSTSVLDTVIGNVSFGFYGNRMNVTVTATDDTSGVHGFVYNYRNASGVSGVNAELINQAIKEGNITYSSDGRTATLVFNIPKEALGSNNQFNGTADFTDSDRSHNESKQQENKRVVVDNISPTRTVTYNTPVNEFGGISYYDGNITGTITINEANFYSQDVAVTYSMNGSSAGTLPVTWTDSSVDVHTGSFTLSGDGDYIIRIAYTDKSGNVMEAYTSNQLTIDTKITEPTYTINGTPKTENGGAYKEDATIGFSYSDQNFNTRDIKLTRTRFKDKDVDVTDQFVKGTTNDKGGSGSFDIPKKVENDGIYTLTISMTDKANHSTKSHVKFTINRYGSVYEYSDYLMSLIKDGGQYVTIEDGKESAITDDLVITEYNADKIVEDSLNILITRDGEPIDTLYKSEPEINKNVEIGDSGWYQYVYSIDKSNFAKDGVYKISLSSKDATNNESISVPDNSIDAKGNSVLDTMQFVVDTTAPEIRNIANLDQAIIDAQEIDVKYSLVDIGGLNTVEVFVDEESVDKVSDFSENPNDYSGNFTIKEKNSEQKVRIRVTDLAGNVTDTNSESFSPGEKFVFFDTVTVSTNFFVRWFANKPLFFGSIAGVIAVLAVVCVLIVLKTRKKKKS